MIRAILQLIRLPNCFTAIPDVWAGWLIIAAAGLPLLAADQVALALTVVGAIGFLSYAGGVAMNDLFDLGHDRANRPERPLPSGRVPLWLGGAISFGPLAVSLALVLWWRPAAWWAVSALIVLIVLYNLLHKNVPVLGLPLMGLCRSANVVVGMSLAGFPTASTTGAFDFRLLILPAVLAVWVLSISVVARLEKRYQLAVRLVPRMILAIALIDALAVLISTGRPELAAAVAIWIIPAALLKRWFAMS